MQASLLLSLLSSDLKRTKLLGSMILLASLKILLSLALVSSTALAFLVPFGAIVARTTPFQSSAGRDIKEEPSVLNLFQLKGPMRGGMSKQVI